MVAEMIIWGFFSAWGWIGANAIKEQIWPETPPAVVQPDTKTCAELTKKQPNCPVDQ